MENTINLNLKLLKYNQAQKEIVINEALCLLDSMIQRTVIDFISSLPTLVKDGDLYINADNSLAIYLNGWRFLSPKDGWIFWVHNKGGYYIFSENKWILQQEKFQTIEVASDEYVLDCNQSSKYRILLGQNTKFDIKKQWVDSIVTVEIIALIYGKADIDLSWPTEFKWSGSGNAQKIKKDSYLLLRLYLFGETILGQNVTF